LQACQVNDKQVNGLGHEGKNRHQTISLQMATIIFSSLVDRWQDAELLPVKTLNSTCSRHTAASLTRRVTLPDKTEGSIGKI
jgi:hypothetical protein